MCGVFVNIIKIFIKVDIIFGVFVNIFGCIRKLLANICNIFWDFDNLLKGKLGDFF